MDRSLPERRREEILAAATHFFARHGYLNADIEVLAADLGIGKGTIYRYFPTKEQLFRSALLRGLTGLHQAITAATMGVAGSHADGATDAPSTLRAAPRAEAQADPGDRADTGTDDGMEQIQRAVVTYLDYFDRHPEVIELMVLERAELKGRGKPTYFSHRERYLGPWRTRLRRLMAAGRIRPMDADIIISCLGMLMYGALVTAPFMSRRRGLAAQARDLVDVLFHGIAVPPPASPA